MDISLIEQISTILTVNFVFHAGLVGAAGLFVKHQTTKLIDSLPDPHHNAI